MTYEVVYHPLVISEDIPKLGTAMKKRVKAAIEEKLTSRPEVFGIPLRHSKKGDRKLRVGDYRIIFRITGKQVKVYIIAHRSVVYGVPLQRRVPAQNA